MVSFELNANSLLNLEDMDIEVKIASLALLSELLTEEAYINSILDIKGLLKFEELIFNENNGIMSNSILCIHSLIPNFNYHKTMYKDNILKRLGEVGGGKFHIVTKLHALTLLRKLIDHANEMEVEMINEVTTPLILDNLIIPPGENLKEITQ
jgi:DNA replication protein DnaC